MQTSVSKFPMVVSWTQSKVLRPDGDGDEEGVDWGQNWENQWKILAIKLAAKTFAVLFLYACFWPICVFSNEFLIVFKVKRKDSIYNEIETSSSRAKLAPTLLLEVGHINKLLAITALTSFIDWLNVLGNPSVPQSPDSSNPPILLFPNHSHCVENPPDKLRYFCRRLSFVFCPSGQKDISWACTNV